MDPTNGIKANSVLHKRVTCSELCFTNPAAVILQTKIEHL